MQRKKNILILTYWSYKEPLIQSYTLPYVKIISEILPKGSKIFLHTLEKKGYIIQQDDLKIIKYELSKYNTELILNSYIPFGWQAILTSFFSLTRLIRYCYTKRISFIHSWCTPAGSIGYLLSKLTGIPLILDSFEPHAESMVENGTWKSNSIAFKLLFWLEKLQAKRAKAVIGLTSNMKNYVLQKYNTELKNYFVKPSCVDFNLFDLSQPKDEILINQLNINNKIVGVYAGKIGGIYLEEELFDFIKVASDYWENRFKFLMLTDASDERIIELIAQANIPNNVVMSRFIEHNDIPKYLALADFAINPVKPVPSKRYCTSIKDGEYWAMGLPVVITPNISDDSEIIENNEIGAVIKQLNHEGYLEAVQKIDNIIKASPKKVLQQKIRGIAEKYRNYSIAQEVYKAIYLKD